MASQTKGNHLISLRLPCFILHFSGERFITSFRTDFFLCSVARIFMPAIFGEHSNIPSDVEIEWQESLAKPGLEFSDTSFELPSDMQIRCDEYSLSCSLFHSAPPNYLLQSHSN